MHPILLKIGPITIYSYGVLIASAFLAAIFLASRWAERDGIDPQKVVDLGFFVLMAAIVGSRLLYVALNYSQYTERPLDVFKIWQGGLVFYGGLIFATLVAILYLKKHRLPVWRIADIAAPCLALGQSIGRWGCFFAGCCYGKPTDLPWGIEFVDEAALAPLHEFLHPTQIYSSINALIIFSILLYIRKIKKFDGQIFWTYILLYSVGRFIIEIFRGDPRGFAMEGIISTSQFIGLILAPIAVFMLLRGRGGAKDRGRYD